MHVAALTQRIKKVISPLWSYLTFVTSDKSPASRARQPCPPAVPASRARLVSRLNAGNFCAITNAYFFSSNELIVLIDDLMILTVIINVYL
jgi:hypothetical protein